MTETVQMIHISVQITKVFLAGDESDLSGAGRAKSEVGDGLVIVICLLNIIVWGLG